MTDKQKYKKKVIKVEARNCKGLIKKGFKDLLSGVTKEYKEIVFVCIGTDRCTGDSLGPLTGYYLKKLGVKNVLGDIHDTVNAKNLKKVVARIPDNALVIAIDACLGNMQNIGKINMGIGSIRPGEGVGKKLLPVGDIYIYGVVNFSGYMDFLVLQNTRLSTVIQMAECISSAIADVVSNLKKEKMSCLIC